MPADARLVDPEEVAHELQSRCAAKSPAVNATAR
jgi:hypothetical protein